MAIYNGPLGSKMRGKVGEIVAAKTVGGQTALRSYQPVVKNPNTLRQQVSRKKLSVASTLAASLADVIGVGYAKAVSGAKMYARNMFVRNIIPVNAAVLTYENGDVTVDAENLPFSAAAGFTAIPAIDSVTPSTGFAQKYIVTNKELFPVNTGEELGMVAVLFNPSTMVSFVKMAKADDGVEFTEAELQSASPTVIGVFVKTIPEAVNGIPTENIPWKFPSNTSAAVVNTI